MRDVCVVTGGAGGMGLAAAKLLGRDHSIVLCDVSRDGLDAAAKELEASGVECKTSVVDITDDQSVAELVSQAMGFGVVRSVVHAAGVSPSMGSAEFIVRINALGTLNVNEAFYPTVEDGFAIVNVASVAAHMFPRVMVPRRHFKHAQRDADVFMKKMTSACNIAPAAMRPGFAYSISKNFVTWYCSSQAARFGRRGGRIVSVSPGTIDTAMGRLEERTGSGALAERSALRRIGEPREVAELLAFCASDRASYLTGIDIVCDGGVLAALTPRAKLATARQALATLFGPTRSGNR
ncbi:oxidoreductase [Mycobacterium sp. E3298]|uniref:SDR family oxidoreductase n=1 Tax=Mycobacterium sp. E3298 TaxID=1856865 RepID=UPI0007FD76D4|nr:SDR family oxidoreductase [Mycobacterium sp. E3298]OBG71250.1 oxidoreductase [Mycobacterium sp. E3298]